MKTPISDAAVPVVSADLGGKSTFVAGPRHATILYVLALLAWLVLGVAMECAADSSSSGNGEPALQDVLEKGLKVRRPVEFKFVSRVCDAVNRGDLPRLLVQRTFLWARRKNARPYPYFQRAMQIQAARLGVSL